jgi:hypothetical protein
MESVLRDVSEAQTRGLPNRSISRVLLGGEDLDGSRLACVVCADHNHTAHLRDCESHIHDHRLVLRGILKSHVGHPEDDCAAALHALLGARFWESEPVGEALVRCKVEGLIGAE